jgi:hypothetical protein
MQYVTPLKDLVARRYSCRSFLPAPLGAETRRALEAHVRSVDRGPLGTALRFILIAALEAHGPELKALGTYGMIRNPAAFIVGAAAVGTSAAEDYGWAMEQLVLAATDLGLGTCWLGGFFTRTSFAKAITLAASERLPAVVAVGLEPESGKARSGLIRRAVRGGQRLPWERLFFEAGPGAGLGPPLSPGAAGLYASALETVRLAPSASNRQPWRIVRRGHRWDFFLSRARGRGGMRTDGAFRAGDLPRVDIGIAMCHFELAARAEGLTGRWTTEMPTVGGDAPTMEHVVTWAEG